MVAAELGPLATGGRRTRGGLRGPYLEQILGSEQSVLSGPLLGGFSIIHTVEVLNVSSCCIHPFVHEFRV